jgi:aminocyclopropanecarboxylate oxidase
MNKMKGLVNKHYEQDMEKNFYSSEMATIQGYEKISSNVDWECSFMYRHQPKSNSHDIPKLLR